MKLKDLLKTLDQHYGTVDFEIIESTYPEELTPQDVLKKYPYAADYEVLRITPTLTVNRFDTRSFDSAVASLLIEVTNGGNN